jgi:hypothetical protein
MELPNASGKVAACAHGMRDSDRSDAERICQA